MILLLLPPLAVIIAYLMARKFHPAFKRPPSKVINTWMKGAPKRIQHNVPLMRDLYARKFALNRVYGKVGGQ